MNAQQLGHLVCWVSIDTSHNHFNCLVTACKRIQIVPWPGCLNPSRTKMTCVYLYLYSFKIFSIFLTTCLGWKKQKQTSVKLTMVYLSEVIKINIFNWNYQSAPPSAKSVHSQVPTHRLFGGYHVEGNNDTWCWLQWKDCLNIQVRDGAIQTCCKYQNKPCAHTHVYQYIYKYKYVYFQ